MDKKEHTALTQIEMFAIQSPCIGVCETNDKGFCKGCMRSREERLYWSQIDDATKKVIIQACKRRRRSKLPNQKQNDPMTYVQSDLFKDSE